ncbi:hypothetical protein PVAND_008759 [Polypedilum vanderplanki]|uniref:Protein translocase subunit SecA n=1 Tax=Polypedilum vanderplanki TaxID=319348 RepID=A0A9J6CAK4_POLVA|nr:hypothetical protein PVAND_008759 [Polypedilum vanderplanki]
MNISGARRAKHQRCLNIDKLKLDVNNELIAKFSSKNSSLTSDEIFKIGKYLLELNGFNSEQKFFVAKNSKEFTDAISKLQTKLFIIFKLDRSTYWNVAYLTKISNTDYNYLMNPFNDNSLNSIRLNGSVKINNQRSNDNLNDDFLALINLEKIVKENLVNFQIFSIPTSREIENFKSRLNTEIFGNIFQKVLCDLENANFLGEFKNFMGELSEYSNLSILAEEYKNILINENENSENLTSTAIDRINRKRAEFIGNNSIRKLSEIQKTENNKIHYEVKIEKNFPSEMRNFSNFLDILFNATDQTVIDERLQTIASKINSDIEILKIILRKKNQEEKPENEKKAVLSWDKIKIKPVKDGKVDENIKSFTELLNGMEIEDHDLENDSRVIEDLKFQLNQVEIFMQIWKNKDKFEIRNWADSKRGKLQKSEIPEAIAVLSRANTLVKGWKNLRNPQLLTVLLYFQMKENHGVLYQVLTGEGKTTIVSLLAVIKILMGEKFIDVITSNSVLAQEGMNDRESFYAIFNISVGCNNFVRDYVRDMKECYKADVVYGTMGNFQGDYLRHGFENLNTRGNRGFGCIILDEVDSILLDNGGHITKLATPFPGMDFIKYVYIKIWQELLKYDAEIPKLFEDKLKIKSEELKRNGTNENELQEKLFEFQQDFKLNAFEDMKQAIINSDPTNIDIIPSHLRDFTKEMLEKWIKNAIFAKYQCHENIRYVIKKNKDGEDSVMPVDFENTGVTLKNTVWSVGLHQFIQLKHNLAIKSETLTSSFISNIGYVKLYNKNIIGMTGTLGSKAEYDLLSKVYDLCFAKVPPYKTKDQKEELGSLIEDDSWIDFIAMNSFLHVKNNRSVLIICRTIHDVYAIKKSIEFIKEAENFTKLKIKLYPDETSSHIVSKVIDTSEVIIATNIAGRGADFKTTDALESNGGLHVCVTFLPTNQRVQDQAFGRTSRQGKKGTVQIIAKASDIKMFGGRIEDFIEVDTFYDVQDFRDETEKARLDKISEKELPKINFMDEIFQKFMSYHNDLRGADTYSKPYLKDLKEHWAFWLKKQDYKNVENLTTELEFEKFKAVVKSNLDNKIYRNPFYYLEEAEQAIAEKEFKKAKEILQKALNQNSNYTDLLYGAHIKLFEISIEEGDALMDRFKTTLSKVAFYGYIIDQDAKREYKWNAIKYLKKAQDGLQKEIDFINNNIINDQNSMNEKFSLVISNKISYELKEEESNRETREISENNENLMFKHILLRLYALKTFQQHCKLFEDQLRSMSNAIIKSRIPQYFKDFKPESRDEKLQKDSLLSNELNELGMLGLGVVYSLQEVYDAHPAVIAAAQAQILSGLAALGIGLAFPPSLSIMGRIAGALISEGISDIVIELITKMGTEYNVVNHIKEKAISYGIAIATAGLSTIVTCTKILSKAVYILRNVASVLRKCPIMKTLCTKIAAYLEGRAAKIALVILQKGLINKNVTTLRQITMTVAAESLQDAMFTVVSEKITTKVLEETLESLKPKLKQQNESKVREKIPRNLLEKLSVSKLNEILVNLSTESAVEAIGNVAKEIGFGIMRVQRSWAMKITTLALDSIITTSNLTTGISKYCDSLKVKLTTENRNDDGNYSTDFKYDVVSTHISEYMYSQIMKVAGKGANTLIVRPIAGVVMQSFRKKENEETSSDISDLFKRLKLDPNATESELKTKIHESAGNDAKKLSNLLQASNEVLDIYKNRNNLKLPVTTGVPKMAHFGNLKTMSNLMKFHLVVNYMKQNGEIDKVHEFGKNFKDKQTIEINFYPGNRMKVGHYILSDKTIEIQSSAKNNCLYDAVSASFKSKGIEIPSEKLREVAEFPSQANLIFNKLEKFSQILNNPITRNLYVKAQNAILLGGDQLERLPINQNGIGYYPNGAKFDRSKIGNDTITIINKIIEFSKTVENAKANKIKPKKVLANAPAKFGEGADALEKKLKKAGVMIGLMNVQLKNEETGEVKTVKMYALSGETEFYFRDYGQSEDLTRINNYELVNINTTGFPNVHNVILKEDIITSTKQSCAATRLNIGLSNELRKPENDGFHVKEILLAEVYYKKDHKTTFINNQGEKVEIDHGENLTDQNLNDRIVDSCKECKTNLPHSVDLVPHFKWNNELDRFELNFDEIKLKNQSTFFPDVEFTPDVKKDRSKGAGSSRQIT